MAATQDGRTLAIHTPLGKDFLLLDEISGVEEISRLFSFDVKLIHEENTEGFTPTIVDEGKILGKGVTVTVTQEDGTYREITGIVNRFSQGIRNRRFTFYTATVVPHVWILTQKFQSRIFQDITVTDILREVFDGFEIKWQIQGSTYKRNYCVQYRESDFDFASRLMEEEGYYYFFEHLEGKHKMVIANTKLSHPDCPSKNQIPFDLNVGTDEGPITSIRSWQTDFSLQTGKVTLWDYNFQLPKKKLDHQVESVHTAGDNRSLEFYDYPGGYSRKYDGIDRSGGEQSGELANVENDKTTAATSRMEMLDAKFRVISGLSDCSALTAGYKFTLSEHPVSAQNATYLVTRVSLQAYQSPSLTTGENVGEPYQNTFTCIPHGQGAPPFRPQLLTPKPIIHGSQTAFVVGLAGEEIYTDKFGRVKVQFHWDRDGNLDSSSSCWVRVAQAWAGNKWGMMFIPRIGMEVIVHFLEGNPDQPIITGCVYNPVSMPPYTLPDEKTKSTLKSDSSKGGAGFNELRFEDKKGSEQIFIHGEKNQDIRIKNDALEFIGHDRHLIIKNEQFEWVKKDKHLKITGDQNEKIDGSLSVNATVDIEKKAGTKFAVDAGTEIHLKAGTTLTLEAGASLTLKVGGNFININAGGVFISGSMVFINSGGAAGSGSGSNPEAPKEAKEADKAEPGSRPELPPKAAPPARPQFTAPAALVLVNAAKDGAPFCEICSRV